VKETTPDLVFLNSVFAWPTISFLIERRRRSWRDIAVIVSLCGELLETAIAQSPVKKKGFLRITKLLRLHEDVLWRASTEREKIEAEKVMGAKLFSRIAPDTTPPTILPDFSPSMKPEKVPGSMRLSFLARIVPNKNLDFVLRLLASMTSGSIELDIIGSTEDKVHWSECERLIEKLPDNAKVTFAGVMPNSDALERLCESHFFILPTKWENFGYVIIEALSAGCPLIISDRTDWNDVGDRGGGWFLPLDDEAAWLNTLGDCLAMNNDEFQRMSAAARRYAVEWLTQPDREASTLELFETALETTKSKKY
jgi:glycosyltransferase involved in cell wall biosynthesis